MTEREATIELGGLRAITVGDPGTARLVTVLAHGFQMEPADLSPFGHSLGLEVAALVVLSASRIAFDEWQPLLLGGRVRGLPVLVSHGEADADLAFGAGEALRDGLAAAGADVTWVPFAEGHVIPTVVWRRLRGLLHDLAA
jgi:hypothetical protein